MYVHIYTINVPCTLTLKIKEKRMQTDLILYTQACDIKNITHLRVVTHLFSLTHSKLS